MRNIIPQNIPYLSIIAHIVKKVNPFAVFLYRFLSFFSFNRGLPSYFWNKVVAGLHLRGDGKLPAPSIHAAFNSFELFSLKSVRFLAEQGQFWEFFV